MQIATAAKLSGLSVKTVRYYADINLISPCFRAESGYRIYDQSKVDQLIFVRRAREFGFSITECRELLDLYSDSRRSSRAVKRIAVKRLAEIKQKQQELQNLHDQLDQLVLACQGDDQPECPIISELAQKHRPAI